MPNYCRNKLLVIGAPEDMKPFLEKAITRIEGEDPLWVMSNLYPRPEPLTRTVSPANNDEFVNQWDINSAMKRVANGETGVWIPLGIPSANNTPEKIAALIADYGASDWYTWSKANWGTKWDCNSRDTGIEILNDTTLQVDFDSAWSPPIQWLEKVANDYPNINFKLSFTEEGMAFCGYVFTTEKDEDGNRDLEEVRGEIINEDEDGESCHYDEELGGWVNDNTDEPYRNGVAIDEDFCPTSKSSVEDETCWFEN